VKGLRINATTGNTSTSITTPGKTTVAGLNHGSSTSETPSRTQHHAERATGDGNMGNLQSNLEPSSTGSPKAATRLTRQDSRRLRLISPMDAEQQRQEKDGREGGGRRKKGEKTNYIYI